MSNKNININFPFKNSPKGYFIDLNTSDSKAIKADLIHLLLTNKGERLYLPDFGTNLRKYLFNPDDEITNEGIKEEIISAVRKYIPNLNILEITINDSKDTQYGVTVKLNYLITDNIFEKSDSVIINL